VPDSGGDLARNHALWTVVNAQFTDEDAHRAWTSKEPTWGLFRVPERDPGVRAQPVGVDLTPAQLATAARCQQRFGLVFPLVEADAETYP
jgi:hypothetical protein